MKLKVGDKVRVMVGKDENVKKEKLLILLKMKISN